MKMYMYVWIDGRCMYVCMSIELGIPESDPDSNSFRNDPELLEMLAASAF